MNDKLMQYARAVNDMRKMQKEYFRSRTPASLVAAKEHEQRVDRITKELLSDAEESLFK